jgi:hypothetical protein
LNAPVKWDCLEQHYPGFIAAGYGRLENEFNQEYTMPSTNYYNTLIEVAPDCAATAEQIPPFRGGKKSIANLQ